MRPLAESLMSSAKSVIAIAIVVATVAGVGAGAADILVVSPRRDIVP